MTEDELTAAFDKCRQDIKDDINDAWEDALKLIEKAIMPLCTAPATADYCTSGPPSERKRRWVVMFDDPDQGTLVFDSEAEAHGAWDRAKDNWTCTLFETCERKYVWAAGALRAIAPGGGLPDVEADARARCERMGIDPDDVCADGGVTAWMVVARAYAGAMDT